MAPCLTLLEAATAGTSVRLRFESYEAGAENYLNTGVALPDDVLRAAADADAILLGAMGHPDIRYPNGTEIVPQIDLRDHFQLFAGLRPIRTIPGVRPTLASPRASDIDFVIVRESTEGLFAARHESQREGDAAVLDTMRITRTGCERLFEAAFELAQRRARDGRSPKVTCVDKANVLPSMAFFREIFLSYAARYPDIATDCVYVDAAALRLVKAPWDLDVVVTENMFGDILSDLGAGLIGGMGMAPSADIGAAQAVFQPCHGTAPDIAGRGLANPTAMFLSGAMMLDWLGERHDSPECREAAIRLTRAVDSAFADGSLVPSEHGGKAGTQAITERVLAMLNAEC
jgi:3-isopropylmalate dehydrogenase